MGKVPYTNKQLVFRETFNNEQSVRANGGTISNFTFVTPTAIPITGTGYIMYNFVQSSIVSVRLKISNISQSDLRIFSITSAVSNLITLYGTVGSNVLNSSVGTLYINGTASNVFVSGTNEIVISNINLIGAKKIIIGNLLALNYGMSNVVFELFEVYKGVLSAQDVKNLYEGKFNKRPNISNKSEYLGGECLRDGNNINNSTWSISGTGWELLSNGSARYTASDNGRYITQINLNMSIPLKGYTYYKLAFTISDCADKAHIYVLNSSAGSAYWPLPSTYPIARFGNGRHEIIIYTASNVAQGIGLYAYNTSGGVAFTISNISLKEALIQTTPYLMNVESQKGYLKETNGITITNTNVKIKKQAEIFANFFTTVSTSKLDLGSFNEMVGNKTIVFWAKTSSWNSSLDSRFADNGRFISRAISSSRQYRVSNDGGSTYASANSESLKMNTWQLIVITRAARTDCPLYINGVLGGSINMAGGVPASATTNFIIGNRSTNDRGHHGFIDNFRIVDGILSTDEIAQIFSSERRKYNV